MLDLRKTYLGYVEDTDFIGGLVNIDLEKDTLTLRDDETEQVFSRESIELLPELFECNGVKVFNKDIFVNEEEKLIQIVLQDDGKMQLFLLNDKLEAVQSGEKFGEDELQGVVEYIEEHFNVVGNIYEFEVVDNFDFNVKIAKDKDNGYFTYWYVCNNKQDKQIDLIKVLYMGHQLLEEEDYQRITLSYEEYEELVEGETLTEVSPQELHNYVLGATYGKKEVKPASKTSVKLEVTEEVVEDEDCFGDCCKPENACVECGLSYTECNCSLW